MGSKNRFAKELLSIILKDRNPNQYYVEPFVGGCNIIDKVDGNRIGNDINYYLIEMWKALINGNLQPCTVTKEQYNDIRNNKNLYSPSEVGYVGFNCSSLSANGKSGGSKLSIERLFKYNG